MENAVSRCIKFVFYLNCCLFAATDAFESGGITFFEAGHPPFFSATTLEFRNYLYTGRQNRSIVNRGNFGIEFPAALYSYGTARYISAGIAANTHLVMFPRDLKFAVDNFYATLAIFFNGAATNFFSWRIYPIYHVSGHLADGAANDSALRNSRSVSSEMVRVEGMFSLIRGLALSFGYGFFYHVCAQQGLTDRFDLSLRYEPHVSAWLLPYCIASGQFISRRGWTAGFDIEAGSKFINAGKHGIGLSLRFLNRIHPGYYFDEREKSAGIQVTFFP